MSNQPTESPSIPARHAAMVRDLVKKPDLILAEITPSKAALLHCAIGIVGEVGEIVECLGQEHENRADMLEEVGDYLFYSRDLRDWMAGNKPDGDLEFTSQFREPKDGPSLVAVAMVACGGFLDVVKKHVIYGQEMHWQNLIKAAEQINICVEVVMASLRITQDEAMLANINKLARRYPAGGYSDGDAAARADKVVAPHGETPWSHSFRGHSGDYYEENDADAAARADKLDLREAPQDLTKARYVVDLMESATSASDWNAKCDQVKSANNGYPDFWYQAIVTSGLVERVKSRWSA